MKTIELSDTETKRWKNDAAFRTEVRDREKARARRLNETVEVYAFEGWRLFVAAAAVA